MLMKCVHVLICICLGEGSRHFHCYRIFATVAKLTAFHIWNRETFKSTLSRFPYTIYGAWYCCKDSTISCIAMCLDWMGILHGCLLHTIGAIFTMHAHLINFNEIIHVAVVTSSLAVAQPANWLLIGRAHFLEKQDSVVLVKAAALKLQSKYFSYVNCALSIN